MFFPIKMFSNLILNKNSPIENTIKDKIIKSSIILLTSPIKIGDYVKLDNYSGFAISMNLFYLKLKKKNSLIFIPTSFIYDKIIEVEESK